MGQFKKKLTIERSLNRKRFLDYRNKKLKLLNSLNKVRANINLYHWWDEPDNVSRILDRKRFFTIINEKIQKAKARDFKDLLSKNKIDKNKISGYLYWLYRDPLRVKTGKLKKLCKYLHIPYIKIEKIIIDRDFPIDLNSEVVVKLFTHILNEGHIRLYKGKIRNILYVNQDPVLIHRVKFLIEKLGGYVFLPPPSKEAFELKSDYLTARIMNKAGIPAGSKTIADFSLHPVILNSEKLMLNHLKWTFIEEGTIGLLFDRHGFLKLYLSLSRSKDITNLFPQHIIKIFQSKYKGKSISVFSEDIPQNIRARILLSFPKVLEQETDFILKMLEKRES
ncbi:MAG: hypothetical protein J7K23_01710 [Thermoproteales archaeon]|nr:hypothetical protein [Thermoproteales archaeon]